MLKRLPSLGAFAVCGLALCFLPALPAHAQGQASEFAYQGPGGTGRLIVQQTGPGMGKRPPVIPIGVRLEFNRRHFTGRGYMLDEGAAGRRMSFELYGQDCNWEFEVRVNGLTGTGKAYSTRAPRRFFAWQLAPAPSPVQESAKDSIFLPESSHAPHAHS